MAWQSSSMRGEIQMSTMNGDSGTRERLLSVRDLRLCVDAIPGFEPVVGATFHANRGEVVGIVGESGSGKSLTLRAIAGLLPPGVTCSDGEIDVDGIAVTSADADELRRLKL